MGLWSWLFPKPADRVRAARDALADGRPADAYRELQDVDHPDVVAVRGEAARALVLANADHAVSWANAADEERIRIHLELCADYLEDARAAGAEVADLEARLRDVRKEIRGIRTEDEAARRAEHEAREARLLAVDPLGFGGRSSLMDGVDDEDHLAEDDDERAARLALIVDAYPAPLRERLPKLGAAFADAVLDLEEGRADAALLALIALPDNEPLVLYERARAAHHLGDPKAGARALRQLHAISGHFAVGQHHTAVLLAQMTAESGDPRGALDVLKAARADEPDLGAFLYAQLCLANGELRPAEHTLRALIASHPKHTPLHKLLAHVRIAADNRPAAMRALEAAMETVCDNPGRCGHKPPDFEIVRLLATLYLEDGVELPRARELMDMLPAGEGWADAYLDALLAVRSDAPDADRRVLAARQGAPDAARARLDRYLPAPA